MPEPLEPAANNEAALANWFSRQLDDIRWFLGQHDVLRRYAGQVVILHKRTILASGQDDLLALENARQRTQAAGDKLPPLSELLFIPVSEPVSLSSEDVAATLPESLGKSA